MAAVEKMNAYGYHDVVAFVDGQKVCWGDMKFVARMLGLSYGTLKCYMSSSPVPGLELKRLPEVWDVDGELLTVDQARVKLGLSGDCKKLLARNPVATRMRWVNSSLPTEAIDVLRRRSKARRKRALSANS